MKKTSEKTESKTTTPPTETPPTGPASRAELWEMHRLVAKRLMENLKGEKVRASMLDTARAFLRDNGIYKSAGAGELMRDLASLQQDTKFPFDLE